MVGGMILALALVPLWNLETRWLVVVVIGISMVSASLVLIRRLDDILLASHLLLLPFASLQKWLFLNAYSEDVRNLAPASGVIGVGLTELLLVGMYVVWIVQIFVARTLPLPRLAKLDFLILLFIAANILSIHNAAMPSLSVFAVVHLFRYALVYFYFSRRLHARHLPLIMVAFALAIAFESALGAVQYKTGLLKGVILDPSGSGRTDWEYNVPGIEDVNRASGTSYDSHAFGLFLAMLLPFPLVVVLSNRVAGFSTRLAYVALLTAGAVAVFVSFSRSAWLTCALTFGLVWFVFILWREKHVILKTACLAGVALIPLPWAAEFIARRFAYEGHQNLTGRYDMIPVAWAMWREHFWTGQGIGNYMVNLPRFQLPGTMDLPVHNVLLWLGADTGLFGVVTFYLMIFAAMWQLARVVRARREPTDLLALAALAALIAYVIDGITNPEFRETLVYMLFWIMMALATALPRIQREIDRQLAGAPT